MLGAWSGAVALRTRVPADGAAVTRSVRVPECADGCAVTGLDVGRDSRGLIDGSPFEDLGNLVFVVSTLRHDEQLR